ncbi:M23 family metallopeptidase [Phenylobacterium sp.]|uniref:M23 family metallopeptidase n=1 Tax=Phenylobacterium sp. TaxID=1871053 RepID=UPI00356A3C1E
MRTTSLGLLGLTLALAPLAARGASEGPKFALPLACQIGRSCEVQHYVDRDPGPSALDYRCGHRTYQAHNGIDIRLLDMAAERAGVDVLAAAAGRVVRLRDGVQDISIRAPGAPSVAGQECGNGVVVDHGDGWETQYCHLARGSVRVKVGEEVKAGQPLAHVGLSGDTEFPHLHFTVRHAAQVVDPFAPDMSRPTVCRAQPNTLWTAAAQRQLTYKAGAVLNGGFASGPVTMAAVEEGGVGPPTATTPLIAYARLIGLETGDVIELVLTGPGGQVLLQNQLAPLTSDKDQYVAYAGKKPPAGGWPHGAYSAEVRVRRAGAVAITRRFTATI